MARLLDEDYAYATARIRAIENRLLTVQRLERLMDAPHFEDAMKMLTESGYGSGSADMSQSAELSFEKLLSDEMKKTYLLLKEILPNPDAVLLFMRRNDYLNAKIILKSEFLGLEHETLTHSGTVEPSRLSRMVHDRTLMEMPEDFKKAIMESVDTYGRTGDPQTIDFIMDIAMYRNMASDAREVGEPVVQDIVNMLQDTANIRIFIRAKLLSKSRDFLSKALLEGSKIPRKTYLDLAEKSLDAFLEEIRFTPLSDLSARLRDVAKIGSNLSMIEKVLDDYILDNVRKSRYVAMGIEPIIAYLFYKEVEIKNVRLILTGKINKIAQETIRERLRAGYA